MTPCPPRPVPFERPAPFALGWLLFSALLSVVLSATFDVGARVEAAPAKDKKPRVGVMVFAREGVDELLRAQVERKLRAMIQSAQSQKFVPGRLYPIEFFYDVGQLSKANLHTARRHFNEGQRALESNDFEESKEQLFRARRFYLKGVPFVRDEPLLQSIFYFDYISHKNLKATKKARDLYCQYVSLSRNLTGSVGPIEQYESLVDLCGESPISGTAELNLKANVDGGHVYINNMPVGVISKSTPFSSPFMSAGVHLVEVRKIGYARWGTLVTLKNGSSKRLRAKLKRARNYAKDFQPLNELPLRGAEAYSDTYLAEFFYENAYKFGLDTLLTVYLEASGADEGRATFLTFRNETLEPRFEARFSTRERNGYYSALDAYWKRYFKVKVDLEQAREVQTRWQPTFFKVE